MPLKFNGAWRFNPPVDGRYFNSAIPDDAIREVIEVQLKEIDGKLWNISRAASVLQLVLHMSGVRTRVGRRVTYGRTPASRTKCAAVY